MTKRVSEAPRMAPKLAASLTTSSRKVIVILAHAFLEWVLILLLLANSVFFYMIRKYANYFGLKQPCILCSRVDQVLEPREATDSYTGVVCETHALEMSRLGYCSNHRKFAKSQKMCEDCFSSTRDCDELCETNHNDEMPRCSCCATKSSHRLYFPLRESIVIREVEEEKIRVGFNVLGNQEFEHQIPDRGSLSLREKDCNEDDEADDHEESDGKKTEKQSKKDGIQSMEDSGHLLPSSDEKKFSVQHSHNESIFDVSQDISIRFEKLKSDLEAEQRARNELCSELEAERNAAAIAANQTMAMITRLQEEKAAMQMEALHYQRVMEEQSEYDQEALQLLRELLAKREREKEELEDVIQGYRQRFSDLDAKEAMMVVQKGHFSPSSIDNDSDVLSIDLNGQFNQPRETNDNDMSLIECSEQWGAIEDSLEELEEERLSIIKQLKELELKLQKGESQNEQSLFADEKQMNNLAEKCRSELDPNVGLCSQEVNLVSCFPTNITSEIYPKTMASVAQKLLDIVEPDDISEIKEFKDDDECSKEIVKYRVENGNVRRLAIEKEMEHVYGRLQALEADTEFIRHCIASVNKGNEGRHLLEEILQNLRELRDAEICM